MRIVKAMICFGWAFVALNGYASFPVEKIKGKAPAYASQPISAVPHERAILTAIWMPELEQGFVPQGLTYAEGQVLVAAYRSKQRWLSNGPTWVFRVDPATGKVTGKFQFGSLGHVGGLAYGGKNVLYVADKLKITRIAMDEAFRSGTSEDAVLGTISVPPYIGTAFLSFDGRFLWTGRYSRAGSARIYRIDPALFKTGRFPDKVFSVEIAARSQGAAFDQEGNLWVSQSSSKFGRLQKINPSTGEVLQSFPMMAGMEDISFDENGNLWSVSEAGAFKYRNWNTFFPVIFQLDLNKL